MYYQIGYKEKVVIYNYNYHMNIIKSFIDNKVGYNITIKGTERHPLFKSTDVAEILGFKQIRCAIKDFDETERVCIPINTLGGIQQVSFLTTIGLYKLLGKSIKPIAKEFFKWVFSVIEEIRLTGQYKLETENKELRETITENKEQYTQNLLQICSKENVIYLLVLQELENGSIRIKIGYSDDIQQRVQNIRNNYESGKAYLIHVVRHQNNDKLEKKIHKNEFVKSKNIEFVKKNGQSAKEVYDVTQDDYKQILQIIEELKPSINTISIEHQIKLGEIHNETLKLNIRLGEIDIEKIKLTQNQNQNQNQNVKIEDVVVDNKSIIPQGIIALLNINKTKIEKLFNSVKQVRFHFNIFSSSCISRAIKNETPYNNKYLYLFENCSTKLKDEYIKSNGFIPQPVKKQNIIILKIDSNTNEILIKFNSLTHVQSVENINRFTLKKYLDKNNGSVELNGFLYKQEIN